MSMIGFPLLLIPFAIYNIFVFLMPGVAFTSPVASVMLPSKVMWTATFGDALLALAMFLLMFEVIKAARPGARYLTDHLLSLIVFGAAVAEFVLLPQFGTSTFFLLTVLTGVEFIAGVSIGFRNRKRPVPVMAERVPAPIVGETFEKPPVRESKPVEPVFPPAASAPESQLVPEPVLKPTPAPVVVSASEITPPADRKVADWSPADLVSDKESDAPAGNPPKP
jgi:hypothetical protein